MLKYWKIVLPLFLSIFLASPLSPRVFAGFESPTNTPRLQNGNAAFVDHNSPATAYPDNRSLYTLEDDPGFSLQWSSEHVFYGKDGKLEYKPDSLGNIIPDFSHVGFYYGDVPIPDIPVVKEISPIEGDNTTHIRNAIEKVSSMPVGDNGFRGTILLKKGVYHVHGNISIQADGIVLRGEGSSDNEDGTTIIAAGTDRRALIDIGTTHNDFAVDHDSRTNIIEDYVPVGRKYVRVEQPENFEVGDQVSLWRPGTQNWISDLRMDRIPGSNVVQWTPGLYSFHFERIITNISGDTIFFRNPVVMAFDTYYGGGEVMKVSMTRFRHIGIENLLLKSVYAHDTDENHSWDAIILRNAEHSWVRDVVAKYFAYSIVSIEGRSKHISVINCQMLEPKSIITGGRRYGFKITGQLNLIKDCYATEGRHDYNTNARVSGPNVFIRSVSERAHSDNGPHHRWAMGTLYDMMVTNNALNVQDRGNSGTGHGWAGVNQVFWNSRGHSSVCQNPWVSGVNYNIGWQGGKYAGWHTRPDGIWEGHNLPGLFPESLYEAQLLDRTSDTLFFSVLSDLQQIDDSTFVLSFNVPADPEYAQNKNNYKIHGTAEAGDHPWHVTPINEYQVKFTFYGLPLLSHHATVIIDASGVRSSEGYVMNGLSMALHTEPDRRPVVYYSFQRVGNGPDDYVSAISSKTGKLYLVKDGIEIGSANDLMQAVENNHALYAVVDEPNVTHRIYTEGLPHAKYFFYATDNRERISRKPHTFVVIDDTTDAQTNVTPKLIHVGTSERTIMITPLSESVSGAITEVYETGGRMVYKGTLHDGVRVTVDAPGVYIVRIVASDANMVFKTALP